MPHRPDPNITEEHGARGGGGFLESLHGSDNPSGLPETPVARAARLEAAQNPSATRDPEPWEKE
jgi:hypothetical protein